MQAGQMDRELLKTLHISNEDVPFVESKAVPGIQHRVLMSRPSEGLTVTHMRSQPGTTSVLHRHSQVVFGWTLSGAWGHDKQYLYTPNTFIYETPSVIHKFRCGPNVTETMFINTGGVIEVIDEESLEPCGTITAQDTLDNYLEQCEINGLGTPKFLQ